MLRQYKIRDYNFRLVLWLLVLSIMGVLLVGSAESTLQFRQLGGVVLGIVLITLIHKNKIKHSKKLEENKL